MKRPRLSSLKAVRIEMSKVFFDSRSGVIEPGDGSKLCYQLGLISSTIQAELIEGRLSTLEKIADEFDSTP